MRELPLASSPGVSAQTKSASDIFQYLVPLIRRKGTTVAGLPCFNSHVNKGKLLLHPDSLQPPT